MKLTADKILSTSDGIKLQKTAKLRYQKAIDTRRKPGHITDYYIVSLTWYTVLRISEICHLKWSDIGQDFLTVTGKDVIKRTFFSVREYPGIWRIADLCFWIRPLLIKNFFSAKKAHFLNLEFIVD